ncbi:DUF427 domain-containing protein [Ovoidimarina sediminis]|uniref:DUF427 domain-containing protein n=1 Tax=Ovoidimarina sediminis TaxID=3079856 RepID=UPI002914135A|nr:DUF427 domain-containing protein [Rhodophyticola sp. MJ-SS7]MDU8946130.1 DUF427 domain-containing protein [Rhodophyticola sp. MJ-SS7]
MASLPAENVQHYPRPPALEPVDLRLAVRLGGKLAAETTRGFRVLETHHAPTYYFPRWDVLAELAPASGGSLCEWKGRARYFDVTCAGRTARRGDWAYDAPTPVFRTIAGCVAFYAGLMEACFVGDEAVMPQPGAFCGGWVTANLEGVPKGARGTEHW